MKYQGQELSFWQEIWPEASLIVVGLASSLLVGAVLLWYTNHMEDNKMCNVRYWPAYIQERTRADFVLQTMMFAVLFLVFFNTCSYFKDAWQHRCVAMLFLFFPCMLWILLWGSEIIVGWATAILKPYVGHEISHLSEVEVGVLFILFLAMDIMMYCRLKKDGNSFLQTRTFLLQAAAVDLPVVIGSVAVLAFSHWMESSPVLGSGPESEVFDVGFRSGALLMHVAVSQVVFLFIYFQYFLELHTLKTKSQTNGLGHKG